MQLYFIRHTSVAVERGICYGQTDVPLSPSFHDEASVVKEQLYQCPRPDAIYCSPLSRCVHLAHFCGFDDPEKDDRLKELNFGDWEMKNWDEIDMSVWDEDWINNPAPNGESFIVMYNRVAQFIDELKEKEYNVVYLFVHGGVINCAKVYFGEATLPTAFDHTLPYGGIATFTL